MVKRSWRSANEGADGVDLELPSVSSESRNVRRSPASANDEQGDGGGVRARRPSSDMPIPQISRKIKACSACRRNKIKCVMDESGPPCRRCADRNLGCVLGKNLQSIIDEKTQYTEAILHDLEILHGTLQEMARNVGLPDLQPLQTTAFRDTTNGSPPHSDRSANQLNHSGPRGRPHMASHLIAKDETGPSCDNSPKITPEDESGLPHVPIHSLYALTKLRALRSPDVVEDHHDQQRRQQQLGPGDGRIDQPSNSPVNDFITRGLISQPDAERLFALFRDRLNAFMYGVGCSYRTLDELRRRSPVLTAAVLTVGALHDPQADSIYGVCSSEFRRLVQASMFDRRVNLDHLRAMCVASYWLSDMSWMLSGFAIRRAAESNLHNSYARAIDSGSENAADGARLWYILNICDQHLATLYGRPAIVHEDLSMKSWDRFLQSPVSNGQDGRLLSQVALLGILGSIRELFGPDNGETVPRAYLHQISHFNKQLDRWIEHWSAVIEEQNDYIGNFPRKGALLHYHFAKLHLYSHIFRGLSGDGPIPHYFLDATAAAVSAATSTIDLILTDPDVSASIIGVPAYLHCMTAFACMFLVKVAVKYGADLADPIRVWSMATGLVSHFRSLPTGRWHLAHLMAPGLEKMVAVLDPSNSTASRESVLAQNVGPADFGPGGMLESAGLSNGMEQQPMPAADGDLFFDYGMSFGLSPVFRFDPSGLGLGDMFETNGVSYGMPDNGDA